MDQKTHEQLIKNGRQMLWLMAGISAFHVIVSVYSLPQVSQVTQFLPGIIHYILFAIGFCLLAFASKSVSHKPELIGAVFLTIGVLLTVLDSLVGEGIGKNIIYLIVRAVFILILVNSVKSKKETTVNNAATSSEASKVKAPWYTRVAVAALILSFLSSTIGPILVR